MSRHSENYLWLLYIFWWLFNLLYCEKTLYIVYIRLRGRIPRSS